MSLTAIKRQRPGLWAWGRGDNNNHPFKANAKVPQPVDLALPR
jgi:hypothetical protein